MHCMRRCLLGWLFGSDSVLSLLRDKNGSENLIQSSIKMVTANGASPRDEGGGPR